MSEKKKYIPEELFDLKFFEEICTAKNYAPLTTFDLELFVKRYDAITHIPEAPCPFDVEFIDKPEYCGIEDNFKLYKILFGTQKNEMIFAVDKDNLISRIMISADMENSEAIQSFSGALVLILRNIGLNVQEIQAFNEMIQNDEEKIVHWCEETQRFIFINGTSTENMCYAVFFAAVD